MPFPRHRRHPCYPRVLLGSSPYVYSVCISPFRRCTFTCPSYAPLTEWESRNLLATFTRMIESWKTSAPKTKFGGMSVDEFRKAVQPNFDARAEIAELERKIEQLQKKLGQEHQAMQELKRPKGWN
jgi:hypothetical protein